MPQRDEKIKKRLASGPLAFRLNKSGNFRGTHENNKAASRKNIRVAQVGKYKKTRRMRDALIKQKELCVLGEVDEDCSALDSDLKAAEKTLNKWKDTFRKARKKGELTDDLIYELEQEGVF